MTYPVVATELLVRRSQPIPNRLGQSDVAARVGKRLSYVTTGQVVPDDIEPARSSRLADMVTGGFSV